MSASGTPLRVHPGAMADLVAKIMAAGGCNDAEATATGEHLIGANLTGHDSHGLVRVPRYHGWLKDGTLNGHTALRTIADLGQLIQFDGDRGIGQYLAREATLVGIERARTNGSAIIALRHAGH
ncbi:MAG: Ldh family oxidoreductase, partial [Pseudomonadota bacterium]